MEVDRCVLVEYCDNYGSCCSICCMNYTSEFEGTHIYQLPFRLLRKKDKRRRHK